MVVDKEKLLAEKRAELYALEAEVSREKALASKLTPKRKKVWPKVVGGLAVIFIGLPLLISAISESALTPEQKAERAARLEASKVERELIAKAAKIESLEKSIERAVLSNQEGLLVSYVAELKELDPEKAASYKDKVEKVKSANAEKERIRKLNDTGNFTIGNYTDEFGDRTSEKFVGYRGRGTFSNSATEGSALKFWVAMDGPTEFDISLYEYAGDNPVKDIFGGDAYVIRFKYSETKGQVTCKNHGNRISCGPQNSAKLHQALKISNQVKFSIYNQRTTSSQYFFTMNANGYTNAMRKLYE